jgi:hypothetical protein
MPHQQVQKAHLFRIGEWLGAKQRANPQPGDNVVVAGEVGEDSIANANRPSPVIKNSDRRGARRDDAPAVQKRSGGRPLKHRRHRPMRS